MAQKIRTNEPKGERVNMRQGKTVGGAFNGGVLHNLTGDAKTNTNLGDGGGVNREGGMRMGQRQGQGAFNGGVPRGPAGGEIANVGDRGGVNREGGLREGRITTGQDNQRMDREGVVGRQMNTDRRGTA